MITSFLSAIYKYN